ncbi:hypothetical protein MKW92_017295, partial [Papaver armeniacum]
MSNPEDPNHGVLRGESESTIQMLSPPPPEPPIEVRDTEMSIDSSYNRYGFIGFDETFPRG